MARSRRRCAVYQCRTSYSRHYDENDCSLFRFPKKDKKRMAWLKSVELAVKLGTKLDNWTLSITDNTRICSKHFVDGWHSNDRYDENYRPTIFEFQVEPDEQQECQAVEAKKRRVDEKPPTQLAMYSSVNCVAPDSVHDLETEGQEMMLEESSDLNTVKLRTGETEAEPGVNTAVITSPDFGADQAPVPPVIKIENVCSLCDSCDSPQSSQSQLTWPEITSPDTGADQTPVPPVIKLENVPSPCYSCDTPHTLQQTGSYICGSCRLVFTTLYDLHAHILAHGLGGSYHYDHNSRTAYPKYDRVCKGTQTFVKFDNVTQTPVDVVEPKVIRYKNVMKRPEFTIPLPQQSKPTMCGPHSESKGLEYSRTSLKTSLGMSLSIDAATSSAINTETERERPELMRPLPQQSNSKPTMCSLDSESSGQRGSQTSLKTYSDTGNFQSATVVQDQQMSRNGCKATSQQDQTHDLTQVAHSIKSVSGNTNESNPISKEKSNSSVNSSDSLKSTTVNCKLVFSAEENNSLSVSPSDSLKYTCVKCKLVFSSDECLQNHFMRHNGILLCDCCDESFASVGELRSHTEAADVKAVEILQCFTCGMIVTARRGVKAHLCVPITSVEPTKVVQQCSKTPFTSDGEKVIGRCTRKTSTFCGETTPQRFIKKRRTSGEEGLQCDTCPAWFENEYFLTSHRVVHKYLNRCGKCNLCFRTEIERNLHRADCLHLATK